MSVGSSQEQLVVTERRGAVALLRFNRPGTLNALTADLIDAFEEALADVQSDPEVGALVLSGSGRGFCSGEDLYAAASESPEAMTSFVERLQEATLLLLDLEKPVVAAVNGPAIGGGAELALACDVRLASETAFFRFPETELGIICTGGTLYLLGAVLGKGRATELLMSGRTLEPGEARDIGFLTGICSQESLIAESIACAQRLAQMPTAAMVELKKGLRDLDREVVAIAMDLETAAAGRLYREADTREKAEEFLGRTRG